MMFRRFWAIFVGRMLEFFRDKSALIWSLVFPLVLLCGFGWLFASSDGALYKIGVVNQSQSSQFTQVNYLQFIEYQQTTQALLKLSQHSLDLVVDFTQEKYWVNDESPNGYIVEQLLLMHEGHFEREVYQGKQIRYIDWLLPGILGMNIMFGSFFGVGYILVRYRKNSVLKRLYATPLTALEFLLAQIASRLVIMLVTLSLVFGIGDLWFDFYMIGSYWRLLFVVLLGALSLISLSLIIASRWESEELTNGVINFLSWPMMILSGVWFSLEGMPEMIHYVSYISPMTHMLTAMREVMFNDADLWQLRWQIAILLSMTVLFLGIGARLFRWHGKSRY